MSTPFTYLARPGLRFEPSNPQHVDFDSGPLAPPPGKSSWQDYTDWLRGELARPGSPATKVFKGFAPGRNPVLFAKSGTGSIEALDAFTHTYDLYGGFRNAPRKLEEEAHKAVTPKLRGVRADLVRRLGNVDPTSPAFLERYRQEVAKLTVKAMGDKAGAAAPLLVREMGHAQKAYQQTVWRDWDRQQAAARGNASSLVGMRVTSTGELKSGHEVSRDPGSGVVPRDMQFLISRAGSGRAGGVEVTTPGGKSFYIPPEVLADKQAMRTLANAVYPRRVPPSADYMARVVRGEVDRLIRQSRLPHRAAEQAGKADVLNLLRSFQKAHAGGALTAGKPGDAKIPFPGGRYTGQSLRSAPVSYWAWLDTNRDEILKAYRGNTKFSGFGQKMVRFLDEPFVRAALDRFYEVGDHRSPKDLEPRGYNSDYFGRYGRPLTRNDLFNRTTPPTGRDYGRGSGFGPGLDVWSQEARRVWADVHLGLGGPGGAPGGYYGGPRPLLTSRQQVGQYRYTHRRAVRYDRQKAEDFDPERSSGVKLREIYRQLTAKQRGFIGYRAKQVFGNFLALGYDRYADPSKVRFDPRTGKMLAEPGVFFMGFWRYDPSKGWWVQKRDLYRMVRADVFRQARLHGVFTAEAMVDPAFVTNQLVEGYGALTGGGTFSLPGQPYELKEGDLSGYKTGGQHYAAELEEAAAFRRLQEETLSGAMSEEYDDESRAGGAHLGGLPEGFTEMGGAEEDWHLPYLVRVARANSHAELDAVREEVDERFSRTAETGSELRDVPAGARPGEVAQTARSYARLTSGWAALKSTDAGRELLEAWEQRRNALAWTG